MFPCGHIYFSQAKTAEAPSMQVLGSVISDAATTSAFSWTELHDGNRIDDFASFVQSDPTLAPLITGLRHHLELDVRSHDAWHGEGGYSYTHQTPELQELVHLAFGFNEQRARLVAHNFLEAACDIHIVTSHPDVYDMLKQNLTVETVHSAVTAIAEWLAIDAHTLQTRIAEFLAPWQQPYGTLDAMTSLWQVLLPYLNDSAFDNEVVEIDVVALRKGLELAVDLVANDYLDVLTP